MVLIWNLVLVYSLLLLPLFCNYFAQLRRCKRWYLHILQKWRNSPNFVESRMHPGWRRGMTLITWNSRRTNPTHTCSLSTDPVNVCFWQHTQETMTTLKRDSDNFRKEQWPLPHRKVTISPSNTDNFHKEQWHSITSSLCYPQSREVRTAWLSFPLTFEQLIFCCLAFGDTRNPNRKSFLVGIKHLEMTSFTQILKTKCVLASRAEWHKLPEILWGHIQQTPAHWPCSPNVNVCFWQLLQETVKTFTTNSDNFHKNSDNFHKRQYNNFHKEQWHSNTMNLWWPQGRSRAGLTFFSFDNLTPYFLLSDIWWQTTNSFLLALNTHNWPPPH